MIHRINVFLLSCIIAISPIFFMNQAFAMFGGWNIGTPNYAGGGNFYYPAEKTTTINGKPTKKTSGFTVPVNLGRVAKVLAGGVGAVALAEAVTMLIGAGVDWVLDPANNSVVYTPKTGNQPSDLPAYEYIYKIRTGGVDYYSATHQGACAISANIKGQTYEVTTSGCLFYDSRPALVGSVAVTRVKNPAYDAQAQEEDKKKSIPLDVVAAQVISNADSHSNADQRRAAVAVAQAAADAAVQEAENDAAKARPFVTDMERGASRDTSETATGSATQNPANTSDPAAQPASPPMDIALEFPVFCSWAGIVCEAAQEVILLPNLLSDYFDQAKQWSKAEDVSKEQPIEVKEELDTDILNKMNSVQFNSSAYCPDDIDIPVSFGGLGSTSLSISYTPLCAMAEQARPVVILMGWLMGAYIITGRNMREGD